MILRSIRRLILGREKSKGVSPGPRASKLFLLMAFRTNQIRKTMQRRKQITLRID